MSEEKKKKEAAKAKAAKDKNKGVKMVRIFFLPFLHDNFPFKGIYLESYEFNWLSVLPMERS